MTKFELPETLGWYRDSAQWILGLSLGGLAGFVGLAGFSERISNSGTGPKGVFLAAGGTVLLAVVAGVLFNLFLAQFGNALEREHALRENKSIEEPVRKELAKKIKKGKGNAARGYALCYWGLLICFFLSLLCFAGVGCWLLVTPTEKAERPVYDFATLRDRPWSGETNIYLLDKNTGQLYRFSSASNLWVEVAKPPLRPAHP